MNAHFQPESISLDQLKVGLRATIASIDWDSLANLGFISHVDSQLGVAVSADRLSRATTVAELGAVVRDASTNS